ncbi:hypothetical protein BDN71DRAFT_1457384 [Pleurotus eryngii]|uniref:Uncharacterized protein n=1 Tax=Pleurotus eryngii TaxID=5323 RepID=A0A9P5ZKQ9_PLEER|nr:hypothetical protein BDN71DRAFT_1457384 [Pleurotus eryngii]
MHIAREGEGIFGGDSEQRMGVASNRFWKSEILVAVVQGAERWWNWAKQPRASNGRREGCIKQDLDGRGDQWVSKTRLGHAANGGP